MAYNKGTWFLLLGFVHLCNVLTLDAQTRQLCRSLAAGQVEGKGECRVRRLTPLQIPG